MKKIILFMLGACALYTVRAGDTTFVLTGRVGHYSAPAKAYLMYRAAIGEKTVQDSIVIQNGVFTFKGSVPYPVSGYLLIRDPNQGPRSGESMQLYLESGKISVTSPDSLSHATVKGGQVTADNAEIKQALKPIDAQTMGLMREYSTASADRKKELERLDDSLEGLSHEVYRNFIKAHPDHVMSIICVQEVGGYVPDYAQVEPLFESLNPEVRATPLGVKYASDLALLKAVSVGAVAPDFTMPDTSGNSVSLHDFRGKYVLVDFWASWCHPCRAENPNVVKAYAAFKDKGFNIIGVSMDTPPTQKAWPKAIQDDHLTWTQVCDLKGMLNSEVARLYQVNAIPQNFLLDPEGKIVARDLRGDALQQKLAEIFK